MALQRESTTNGEALYITFEMPYVEDRQGRSKERIHEKDKENQEVKYELQAEHLGQYKTSQEAKFITPLDPVIETVDGGRLPVIPVDEAVKLNKLRDEAEGRKTGTQLTNGVGAKEEGALYGDYAPSPRSKESHEADATLLEAAPPPR